MVKVYSEEYVSMPYLSPKMASLNCEKFTTFVNIN